MPETVQQSRRRPLVLYVEDDDQTFETYSRELAKGRELIRSRTGSAAVKWLQEREESDQLPNLIVMSYRLPDMTGIELMAYLKMEYGQLMFMMLSNHHTAEAAEEAIRLGALNAILTTVLSPPQVGRRLREDLLRRRGQLA